MKKKIILCSCIFILLCIIVFVIFSNVHFYSRDSYTYDPEKAVQYSYEYIYRRNPDFPIFENNCTNYISQCLLAGGIEMDDIPTSLKETDVTKVLPIKDRWFCCDYDIDCYQPIYYNVSSPFTRSKDFIYYWSKIANVPYYTIDNTEENIKDLKNKIKVGDILILHSTPSHCAIVVKIDENGIYYNSNTKDRYEYSLDMIPKETYRQISYFNFVK